MNKKKQVSPVVIAVGLVAVLGFVAFMGFKTLSGPARQAPSAPEMYDAVGKLAIKSGGDYSKLSPSEQKYLELMSHGHGQKLLANQFARVNGARGK
ncbi:MAG: hypothetical protein P4L46_08270 [Fimbriimonas sp.]|nr:hypothetical protein [Fimbriimonas sp.]